MGCDPDRQDVRARDRPFQSTHPHGVRQRNNAVVFIPNEFQSTHPHGVRPIESCDRILQEWFQSTHPHGVRQNLSRPLPPPCCFNPRTHMGCDNRGKPGKIVLKSFNPRTHMGCDSGGGGGEDVEALFQSTHPHGVRQLSFSITPESDSFNPRTHMGCDLVCTGFITNLPVSIHAPTWGATLK